MKIIIHADDFGYDRDTCNATIDAFERGLIKSASIMPTAPAANKAIEYAKQHPQYSYGIHLTFVDGFKAACPDGIRKLTDNSSCFLNSRIVRKRAFLFSLSSNDILKEILAQIEIVESAGIKISHLDSHGHLHKLPPFLLALKKLRKYHPDLKVRRVQNIHLHHHSHRFISPFYYLNRLFDNIIQRRFITTNLFYMPANQLDTKWGGGNTGNHW